MKKIFLLTLVLLFSFTLGFSQGFWTQKQSLPSNARCSGIGVATNTKGYLIGGYLGGYDHFKETWEYDPSTNTWLQRADFPGAKRRWLIGFVLNDKVYVGLGGFMNGPSNYTYYSDFYEFNPDSNVWHQKASFPGTPRVSAFCFNSDNKGYVGGGLNGYSVLSDLWRYNPVTDNWIQKNNITCGARWGCSSFSLGYQAVGKTVYVGLGYNGSSFLKDFWEYNIAADSWIQRANLPGVGRWYGASFAIGNYGYMGTGSNGSSYLQDFYQYDRGTDTWVQIPNLTGPGRCEAISFFINDKGYVSTGATSASTYTTDLWELTPSWYTNVEKITDQNEFSLYPNPATDHFQISLSDGNTSETVISVFDINGKLTLQKKIGPNQKTINIDCANFARGKYFIRLGGKETSATKTFVKL
jgi:N-acetylneuraminic acid mutarotase